MSDDVWHKWLSSISLLFFKNYFYQNATKLQYRNSKQFKANSFVLDVE